MKCEICGMAYVPELPDNVHEHIKYHDKVANGLRTRALKTDRVIWSHDDMRITVVKQLSPLAQLRRAEEVARLARRDTPYGSEQVFDDRKVHAFLLIKGDRAIGLVVIDEREHIWKASWADLNADKKPQEIIGHPPIWSICMVWIHQQHRRSGLGQFMVSQAVAYLGCDLGSVGWYTEFTDSGKNFVRKCCPETFYIAK